MTGTISWISKVAKGSLGLKTTDAIGDESADLVKQNFA
jgi:hypothetical protein